MFKDEIAAAAAKIVGESPEMLDGICASVINSLTLRLKDGISPDDIKDVFVTAAALESAKMYEDILGTGAVQSYSAGGISVVKTAGGGKNAAESLLSPYLKDDGFSFLEVR